LSVDLLCIDLSPVDLLPPHLLFGFYKNHLS
jgi:hypothetical protein